MIRAGYARSPLDHVADALTVLMALVLFGMSAMMLSALASPTTRLAAISCRNSTRRPISPASRSPCVSSHVPILSAGSRSRRRDFLAPPIS